MEASVVNRALKLPPCLWTLLASRNRSALPGKSASSKDVGTFLILPLPGHMKSKAVLADAVKGLKRFS